MINIILALIKIVLCGYLWRLAGKGGFKGARMVRYLGVPLIMCLYSLFFHSIGLCLLVLGLRIGGMFLSGYGVSTPIRKFFKKLFKGDGWITQFSTRFVNGILWIAPSYFIGFGVPQILFLSTLVGFVGAFIHNDVVSDSLTGSIVGAV